MLAVELHPDRGRARAYCEALQRHGILCKETHGSTIRISPPLIITKSQVDEVLDAFAAVFCHDQVSA
jgi:ornithine--oxo-acid transaminase